MLFSRRLSLSSIIQLSRALRHSLSAGLTLRDVFRQQARRGPPEIRPLATRVCQAIDRGDSLKAALKLEKVYFPPLFLSLAGVGEETGNLPEIFGELEKYYLMQQKFIRQFLTQSFLPVMQFFAAIFIIAGLMYILGFIASTTNTKPLDPLGLGLTGTGGAVTFLAISFGSIGALIIGYVFLSRSLQQKAVVDEFLLRMPVIGPFLRALAMARFALALKLTLDSAAPIVSSLDLSLRATGNAAFACRAEPIKEALRSGGELSVALTDARLFSEDFLHVVAVGEESGRLPEVMGQQAQYFEEEAGRCLAVLTRLAGFGVWLCVATLIIISIFRIFNTVYLAPINQLLQ